MTEQWKEIPGYKGLYAASNTGKIATFINRTRHMESGMYLLSPKKRMRKNGMYDLRVDLWKNGEHKSMLVSRLVAKTWCPGYRYDYTVNHIDGNPLNNCADNLEWIKLEENITKGFENGLYPTQKQCSLVRGTERFTFRSQSEASRFLGRPVRYISRRILHGHTKAYSIQGDEYVIGQ